MKSISISAYQNYIPLPGVTLWHGRDNYKIEKGKFTYRNMDQYIADIGESPTLGEVLEVAAKQGIIVKYYALGKTKPKLYKPTNYIKG